MYFPQTISQVEDFIQYLSSYSTSQKIEMLQDAINQVNCTPFSLGSKSVRDLLCQYKNILEIGGDFESKKIDELENEKHLLEEKLRYALSELGEKSELLCCIAPDVKAYKNLYIFILSRPNNNTAVTAEILSCANYIDKMTRDVTFIMPGYKRAEDNGFVVNEPDVNMPLTFDENVFINIIQDLENKSEGKFLYKDECELIFVGVKNDGKYDFDSLVRLNLEFLSHKRNMDPVKLILSIAQRFRADNTGKIDIKRYINQVLGELTMQDNAPTKKVFIAGAKRLKKERSLIREELSKVENTHNIDIRSLTFEDFATSLTGKERGRQADYNKFIEDEACAVVFIFDTNAGEITEEEFGVAYKSLIEFGHPNIFVYVRKHNLLQRLFMDSRLRNIKNRIFKSQKEYYVEYENLDNLRYLFYSDMVAYFLNKDTSIE